MKQRRWRIAMDVPAGIRAALLERFKPRFTQAYCWSVTWAYDVAEDYPFDPEPQTCTIYGLHTSTSFQSFAVRLGPNTLQPSGRVLHIVYTTMPGVAPAHAGLFEPNEARPIDDPLTFTERLRRYPLWRRQPTTVLVD